MATRGRAIVLGAVGAFVAPVAAGAAAAVTAGYMLVRPVRTAVGSPPADFPARLVEIAGSDGTVAGWFARGTRPGAVLLLHGYRGCRLRMLDRARLLRRHGYSVLLIDCQAHGESPGRQITFGWRESRDAAAALAFLRAHLPGERVAVLGTSQGAAATLVGPMPLPADALILESMYPTIHDAVAGYLHIRVRKVAVALARLLTLQLRPRLGISAHDLRPVDRIAEVTCPVFLLAGTRDGYAPVAECRRLFDRIRGPKELWMIDGAAHEDLYDFAPAEYESRVLAFLASTLRPRG